MGDLFHASLEGAQHGGKDLATFAAFTKAAGGLGIQPSNFQLQDGEGNLLSAATIRGILEEQEMRLDGISAHCPFWVHGAAPFKTKSIRNFVPAHVARMSVEEIVQWEEDYICHLLDLCKELGVGAVAMFWGPYLGLELASGYPWGMWSYMPKKPEEQDLAYDLVEEGLESFVKCTDTIRCHARALKIALAHEIHPGTAAQCADDFLMLHEACDEDWVLGVNADCSHCWDGEDFRTRFELLGDLVVMNHVKDHRMVRGRSRRSMKSKWAERGMRFTMLGRGDLDLYDYVALLMEIGYPKRYRDLFGLPEDASVPLVSEAEDNIPDLDFAAAAGVRYIAENLCFPAAKGSFEDEMGAQE